MKSLIIVAVLAMFVMFRPGELLPDAVNHDVGQNVSFHAAAVAPIVQPVQAHVKVDLPSAAQSRSGPQERLQLTFSNDEMEHSPTVHIAPLVAGRLTPGHGFSPGVSIATSSASTKLNSTLIGSGQRETFSASKAEFVRYLC